MGDAAASRAALLQQGQPEGAAGQLALRQLPEAHTPTADIAEHGQDASAESSVPGQTEAKSEVQLLQQDADAEPQPMHSPQLLGNAPHTSNPSSSSGSSRCRAGSGQNPSSSSGTSSNGNGPLSKLRDLASDPAVRVYLAPAAVFVMAACVWLLRRARHAGSSSSSKKGTKQRQAAQHAAEQQQLAEAHAAAAAAEPEEPESTLPVYASDFSLHTNEVSLVVSRPAALEGLTCVVSEHIPIQGATIGCGLPSVCEQLPQAPCHAHFIERFLIKGFTVVGQGATQPCNYPNLGTNMRNPTARGRVAGGGATGTVAAVAMREADIGLGTDWLGSVRLPAACMGQYAFVSTPGVFGQGSLGGGERVTPDPAYVNLTNTSSSRTNVNNDGEEDEASSSVVAGEGTISSADGSGYNSDRRCGSRRGSNNSYEAAGLVSGDLSVIRRVAEFMALPGMSDLRGDLTQVVVAEDLFGLCEHEMEDALLAMKRAVIHWAGQEQAGSVQLLPFLETNCKHWRKLAKAADASPIGAATTRSGRPIPPVLRALTYAAQLLLHDELHQRYGQLVSAAAAEGGQAATDLPGVQHWVLDPLIAAALEDGAAARHEKMATARKVLEEVQELLRKAVKHDVVVVLPCIPSAPPRRDAPADELSSWLMRTHAFAALTALGGCPTVVLPFAALPDGSAPLPLALFGHSRTDQRLLTVAERLSMYAKMEFRNILEKAAADRAAVAQAAAVAAAAAEDSSKARGRARPKQQPEQVDQRRVLKAEKAKQRGNDAYKAGKHRDAIKAYTEASKLDPSNPVYLSNRALCHLKMFSFEAAEADCNAVLGFPQLPAADRVKALLRRGTARIHKGEQEGAKADFREVLALEPNNRQAREELKALQQQERDMQEERRQQALAAVAAAAMGGGTPSSNGSSNGPLAGLPPSLMADLQDLDPAAAAAAAAQLQGAFGGGSDGGSGGGYHPMFADAAAGGPGGGWGVDPQQFASLLQSGELPVLLGQDGGPVLGPGGEPVIVGPDGRELTVGPSGRVQPYVHKAQRRHS